MINAILANVFFVNYVAFTCDEVNIMDNGNWISIHTYVMQNWTTIPMLISSQKVANGVGLTI
jgi:hypothetical protein